MLLNFSEAYIYQSHGTSFTPNFTRFCALSFRCLCTFVEVQTSNNLDVECNVVATMQTLKAMLLQKSKQLRLSDLYAKFYFRTGMFAKKIKTNKHLVL